MFLIYTRYSSLQYFLRDLLPTLEGTQSAYPHKKISEQGANFFSGIFGWVRTKIVESTPAVSLHKNPLIPASFAPVDFREQRNHKHKLVL
jgi:hypothetical protein